MQARPLTRLIIPIAAVASIGSLMVFSATRTLAFPPQETVLTRAIVIDAFSNGLTVDTVATSGATPSQVAAILEAVRSTNNELQTAVAASAAREITHRSHEAVVVQIKSFGLTDQLDTARTAASDALDQAEDALESARQAWIDAMEQELDGVIASTTLTRLANATLNHSRAVPPAMRVLDPSTTDWTTLERAWSELDAVEVASLPASLQTAWQTALSNPDVVTASASHSVNLEGIRTAFVQVVQQLPAE